MSSLECFHFYLGCQKLTVHHKYLNKNDGLRFLNLYINNINRDFYFNSFEKLVQWIALKIAQI